VRSRPLLAGAAALLLLTGCGAAPTALARDTLPPAPGGDIPAVTPSSAAATGSAAAASLGGGGTAPHTGRSATAAPSGTVWLCRPGASADPCVGDRSTTAVDAHQTRTITPSSPANSRSVDCFYVYPTVSNESSDNSDLQVQQAETDVAREQASQFSSVCDVWAPMYRQITWTGLAHGSAQVVLTALGSLTEAFDDYMAHDNRGRPIVFIGHSQGAAMLIMLLRNSFDRSPSLRHQLMSAIILGGDLTVAPGSTVGGAFQNIPACTSPGETGCVIAYSSFLEEPPQDTGFGKPGQGAALLWGETQTVGQQVLCTDPAALDGNAGALKPLFLTSSQPQQAVTTPWVTYPQLYTSTCQSKDGITWLQVNPSTDRTDARPRVKESSGPAWGLHGYDVNLALGNLVDIVAGQEASYH
jgi:Protein of unknown function (DUF3089)